MEADSSAFPECEIIGSRLFFASLLLAASVLTAGFVSAGQFLFGAIPAGYAGWAAYRFFLKQPCVRVTSAGIVDHTFWYSPGLIPWGEILEVRETRWGLIEIDLQDETAFWEEQGVLGQLARIKQQLYGLGPAVIVPWVLKGRRSEIVGVLQDGLDTFVLESWTDPEGIEAARPPGAF